MSAFTGAIQQAADDFANAARQREQAAADALVRAYALVRQDLAVRYEALANASAALNLSKQEVDAALALEFSRVSVLLNQADDQLLGWLADASETIRQEQAKAIAAAQADQSKLAAIVQGPGPHGITATFNQLPVAALSDLLGTLQDGSPLRALLDSYGKDASKQARDALVTGLAQGQHPFTIARNMVKAMDGNAVRALTVARTETLRAYRESSLRFFNANADTITGWIWWSARTARTCPVCWAMHGSKHSLDEHFGSHPNCRCTMLPITKTWAELGFGAVPGDKPLDVPSGEELFAKQTAARQKEILGPAKYKAWQEGSIALGDLIKVTRDPDWGLTRTERSLKDALATHGAKSARSTEEQARAYFALFSQMIDQQVIALGNAAAMAAKKVKDKLADLQQMVKGRNYLNGNQGNSTADLTKVFKGVDGSHPWLQAKKPDNAGANNSAKVSSAKSHGAADAPMQSVPLAKVMATNPTAKMSDIQNPSSHEVVLAKYGKTYYVVSGNANAAAQVYQGKKAITARVVVLDGKPPKGATVAPSGYSYSAPQPVIPHTTHKGIAAVTDETMTGTPSSRNALGATDHKTPTLPPGVEALPFGTPRRFNAANANLREYHLASKEWAGKLTRKEHDTVVSWSGSGYTPIRADFKASGGDHSKLSPTSQALKSALEKGPPVKPQTIWRGIRRYGTLDTVISEYHDLVGTIIKWDEPASTTTSPRVAARFSESQAGVVFEIRPRISNTAYITGVSVYGEAEYEAMILPSRYHVVRVEINKIENDSGQLVERIFVTLDELPYEGKPKKAPAKKRSTKNAES